MAAFHEIPTVQSSLDRLLVLCEDIVVPNIDVVAGDLMSQHGVLRYGRSVMYKWLSPDFQRFVQSLETLVLQHPVARHFHFTASDYAEAIKSGMGAYSVFSNNQNRDDINKATIMSAILQDIRTVLMDAYNEGISAVSNLLDNLEIMGSSTHSPSSSSDESKVLVKMYFDSAVYSPRPQSIEDALEIRANPRIERWRSQMREWQTSCARGELTIAQIKESISDANSYIAGAKFAHHLVPHWIHYALFPAETFMMFAPLPHGEIIHTIAVGAVGLQIWVAAIQASVFGKAPLKSGWYLLGNAH